MKWAVTSDRLVWQQGTVLTEEMLAGCNIAALVAGGHLSPVQPKIRRPVVPVAHDPADEPEEKN